MERGYTHGLEKLRASVPTPLPFPLLEIKHSTRMKQVIDTESSHSDPLGAIFGTLRPPESSTPVPPTLPPTAPPLP